jgi:hypothetical protein
MHILALLIALFLASPALAQFWGHYENARFGYALDIPPGFSGSGESDKGDGQLFFNVAAEQMMSVRGKELAGTFEGEAAAASAALRSQGWTITEQSTTADWATITATRDHRLTYERTILLCDGARYATVSVEFHIRDAVAMDGVLQGLARSFMPVGC